MRWSRFYLLLAAVFVAPHASPEQTQVLSLAFIAMSAINLAVEWWEKKSYLRELRAYLDSVSGDA